MVDINIKIESINLTRIIACFSCDDPIKIDEFDSYVRIYGGKVNIPLHMDCYVRFLQAQIAFFKTFIKEKKGPLGKIVIN